ncbi:MAG TPA: hypothetical protein VFM94_05775, partial [Solirubrobacterales bacterium]|nr:hypothetical protein [Solirubrobacterales bacterium]
MIRNLKVLGLSLVAVFALGAVMASGAMAQNGLLTADGPFYLTGTDEATGNALTYPGEEPLVCPGSHYKGEKEKSSAPLTSGSSA